MKCQPRPLFLALLGAGLALVVIGATVRAATIPRVGPAAARSGLIRPRAPSPGDALLYRKRGPALDLLAAAEKKPPKESDFPELYVKQYPEKPAPGFQVYTLSGGEDPKTPIVADDDVTVRLNGEMIFADNDGWACPDDRGGKWKGAPITFHAKPDDKITIILYDLIGPSWGIGPVYLHRADGKHDVLQPEVHGQSDPGLNQMLFTNGPPGPNAKRHKMLDATWTIKDIIP
jgi:hypothetical protein